MKRKLISVLLLAATLLSLATAFAFSFEADALTLTMPSTNGKTAVGTYYIGTGTSDELKVNASKFIPAGYGQRPGTVQEQFYLVIHNTGNYAATASGYNHWSWLTGSNLTSGLQSYHYVVGSDGAYQLIPENEKAYHTGTNTSGNGVTNSTAIGMEVCVNGFTATGSYEGEQWNTTAMKQWYTDYFAQRTGYAAMLAASICVRNGFNPYTQVKTHYSVYGKDCPMQMRYIFGKSTSAGSDNAYYDGANGTYWLIFWDKMIQYYEAFGGKFKSTDNTVVGSNGTVKTGTITATYKPGVYKISADSLNIRDSGSGSATLLGAIPQDTQVTVTEVSNGWGKTTYNGITGWISLSYTTFVSAAAPTDYMNCPDAPVSAAWTTNAAYATSKSFTVENSATTETYILQGWTLHPDGISKFEYQLNGGAWQSLKTAGRADLESHFSGYPDYQSSGYQQTMSLTGYKETNTVAVRATTKKNAIINVGTVTIKVTFTNPGAALKAGSTLTIDNVQNNLLGVKASTTTSALTTEFTSTVEVYNGSTKVDSNAIVCTGFVIKAANSATQIVVVIKGDTDGDGNVTINDYAKVKASFKNTSLKLAGSYLTAGDVNGDGKITVTDFIGIKRHVSATYNLYK